MGCIESPQQPAKVAPHKKPCELKPITEENSSQVEEENDFYYRRPSRMQTEAAQAKTKALSQQIFARDTLVKRGEFERTRKMRVSSIKTIKKTSDSKKSDEERDLRSTDGWE